MTGPLNLTVRDGDGKVTEMITILPPGGEPPTYKYDDVDGDWVFATTADINGTPGVYFRTTRSGASVPVSEIPAMIAQLQVIAAAAETEVTG